MPDYYAIHKFVGKKGPATYKAAKTKGKGNYASHNTKPAQKDNVTKKVKRISNKIMKFKTKQPGTAANSATYGGNDA